MPTGTRLFAYGSLMFPEVWLHVVGRQRPSTPAELSGHTAFTVAGYSFPGLVPAGADALAPGRLYSGLDGEDWRKLDAFEDTFYRREVVVVTGENGQTHQAEAYLVMPDHRDVLSEVEWGAEWFAEHALADFLDRICGFET